MSTLCRCQSVNSVPFQENWIKFYSISLWNILPNLILQRIFFVVIEEKKKGRRDGEKNLRLLLRLSSSFTTLNCKVDFYSLGDQDEEANRTCHLCAQLWTIGRSQKGEKKKTFENLQDFAYIDQDEWKSNNLEKGGAKDQMKRRKKAQIVKLV